MFPWKEMLIGIFTALVISGLFYTALWYFVVTKRPEPKPKKNEKEEPSIVDAEFPD